MNLSSYLQMPPAPLVPNTPSNAMPQGQRTGVAPSSGTGLGFDFAQVMARQLERLAPQERQNFAAHVPAPAEAAPAASASQRTEDHRNADRSQRDTDPPRDSNPTDTHASADGDDRSTATPSHARSQRNTRPPQRAEEVETLLEGLMQGTPVATTTVPAANPDTAAPLTVTALATAAATVTTTTEAPSPPIQDIAQGLRTVALSPHMRIITDPKAAPSPESLVAFAQSMGLDEGAIQNLLAQQPATPVTTLAPSVAMAMPGATGSALPTGATSPQTSLNALLQDTSARTAVTTDSATSLPTNLMTAAADAGVVSGAGLAAPAATLAAAPPLNMPGLTATDMANIQQLQITVLPAVVLPVNVNTPNATVPSTHEMLSLLGTGIDEHDVGALLSRFGEDSSNGASADQQNASGEGDGNHFSSFAQVLNGNKNAATANPTHAAQAAAAKMSEVYDQLSDKMTTELAARMHKQLSDGEWKMKFALRPSNLGGVEIQLEMKNGKLDAVFRADNPLTRDLLQNSSQRLKEALGNFGINAGQVNVGQGGGNTQHHSSGNSSSHSQVRDNSSSQVSGQEDTHAVSPNRHKANASLLDLYA